MFQFLIYEIFPIALKVLYPRSRDRIKEKERIDMLSNPKRWGETITIVCRAIDLIKWGLPYKKNNIVISQELFQKLYRLDPSLTASDYSGVFAIIQELENKESLIPRMSRSQKKNGFFDPMFLVWGIAHLHLNNESHKKRNDLRASSANLLFLHSRVDQKENVTYFCLLDILPHKSISDPDTRLVEISYKNWPGIFFAKINRMASEKPYTAKETMSLWKSGMSTTVTLKDGTVLIPQQGGITTAKTSIDTTSYLANADSKDLLIMKSCLEDFIKRRK